MILIHHRDNKGTENFRCKTRNARYDLNNVRPDAQVSDRVSVPKEIAFLVLEVCLALCG